MMAGVFLSVHTPRYCTLEAAFEGKLASEVFRPVRDGMVAQGADVARCRLDVAVVNSCHLISTFPTVVDGTPRHRGVLTAQEAPELIHGVGYDYPGDYELAAALVARGKSEGRQCVLANDIHYPLDYGTVMPMVCYLDRAQRLPMVPVSVCLSADLDEAFAWGRSLAQVAAASPKRVGFVASGSVSHKLVRGPERAPTPADQALDHEFARLLAAGEYEKLWRWLPGYADAAEPEMGGRHLATMLGVIIGSGERFEATVHAYGPSSGSGNYVISLLAAPCPGPAARPERMTPAAVSLEATGAEGFGVVLEGSSGPLETPRCAGAATSHGTGGDTMVQMTRRTFLGAATAAAAGAAVGPAVRRGLAQGAPLKVGLVLPYTGVYAVLGESITQGMELVFAREGGTVAGRKIEMIKEDDEMKPPVGIRKTEKLIDSDKVDILTGPVHSGILMGMRDKVHASKTILIVSNAGADAISRERCSKWIFRTSFSNWQPNQPMGGWVAKNVSKEVFLLAPNYQAGKDQLEAFKETFLPAGGKIVGEDYPKLGETVYDPYLTKIRSSGAKAVYAFFSGTDAVNFVQQFDQFGLKQSVKLTGAGFLTEPDVLPAQGKAALGVITGHFYTPLLDNPTNQRFVKDFREKFGGKMPDGFACQGNDTAEVIVRAVKAVNGNTQDKDKLVAAIAKTEFESPRGHFRFDPKTQNVIQPFIYIREVKEVAGGLNNVPIDKVADVRDPGTGCTLPA